MLQHFEGPDYETDYAVACHMANLRREFAREEEAARQRTFFEAFYPAGGDAYSEPNETLLIARSMVERARRANATLLAKLRKVAA